MICSPPPIPIPGVSHNSLPGETIIEQTCFSDLWWFLWKNNSKTVQEWLRRVAFVGYKLEVLPLECANGKDIKNTSNNISNSIPSRGKTNAESKIQARRSDAKSAKTKPKGEPTWTQQIKQCMPKLTQNIDTDKKGISSNAPWPFVTDLWIGLGEKGVADTRWYRQEYG